MKIGTWFWIIFVFWALFGLGGSWASYGTPAGKWSLGGTIILLILLGILGYAQFGSAVK